jgi:hypothetical protein
MISFPVLSELSRFPDLEELDLGWSVLDDIGNDPTLGGLPAGCPKLKKIFLSSCRHVNDRHLEALADHCAGLEQIDLVGVGGVSHAGVEVNLFNWPISAGSILNKFLRRFANINVKGF